MKIKDFEFKYKAQDFIVDEVLYNEPSGKGKYLYIKIEKKNVSTMKVLQHLEGLGYKRNRIGIAGLKDKTGFTRQRFSISRDDLKKGDKHFINGLTAFCKILKVEWHSELLRMGKNKGNHFYIRLRGKKSLSKEYQESLHNKIKEIEKNGFPNFYGKQRFGKTQDNWKIGQQIIINSTVKKAGRFSEHTFKVQGFASYVFNQYILERYKKGQLFMAIAGDILIDNQHNEIIYKEGMDLGNYKVTGPVIGNDLHSPCNLAPGSQSCNLESSILKRYKIDETILSRFKQFGVNGLRRPILCKADGLSLKIQGNDLLLSFELGAGSYASELVWTLLEGI